MKYRGILSLSIKLIFCITALITGSSTTSNVYHFGDSQSLNNIKVAWINFVRYTERYFNSTSFFEKIVVNVGTCQRLCILKEECKGFNMLPINGTTLQCELFNKTFYGNPCKLERHMTATHHTISNPCVQIYDLCEESEKCVPDDSMSSYSCQNKSGLTLPEFCPANKTDPWIIREAAIPTPFCHVCYTSQLPGSLVILHMLRGERFSRNWMEYKNGFGGNSFYVGNELVHKLTTRYACELYAHMSGPGEEFQVSYAQFSLGNETDLYRLTVSGFRPYLGDILDEFSSVNGVQFSTYDHGPQRHAANTSKTGGWYPNDGSFFSGYWKHLTSNDTTKYFTNIILKLRKKK